jgi:hypothetical protein
VENSNREAGAEDIANYYMETVDPSKSNSRTKWKSSSSTEISQPSVRIPVRASPDHVNSNEGYQHVMSCIYGLKETISQLVASIKPIVSAWNEHNSMDSDEVRGSIDIISSCLEILYTNAS